MYRWRVEVLVRGVWKWGGSAQLEATARKMGELAVAAGYATDYRVVSVQ